MDESVRIELARRDDLSAVLGLLARNDLPPDGLAERFDHALVARRDGDIVGSAVLEVYGDAALLRSVAVDPTLRSQGLGRRLTEAALERARREGVQTVYLLTTTAGDYFPRFGFRPVAREAVAPGVQASVEFTSVCPASSLVMKRELGDWGIQHD